MVRLPVEIVEVIDDFRRHESDVPSRPEMIRRLLMERIEQSGGPTGGDPS